MDYDRVIRDEESTWDVIRYIIDNPLRGGLVSDITQYPFLGSGVMGRDELLQELSSQPENQWHPGSREQTRQP